MPDELKELKKEVLSKFDSHNIDDLWSVFRDGMHNIVNKHVPSKMLKPKDKLPYITHSIEKLIRKRNFTDKFNQDFAFTYLVFTEFFFFLSLK